MNGSLVIQDLLWTFPGGAQPFLTVERLTVPQGTVLAVTGPSGAGKSTFLHLLAGLETPDSGMIVWGDYHLEADRPSRRDRWRRRSLGLVFQDFQLVPELSAIENVLLPLTFDRWRVTPGERNKARQLLHRLGVERISARASTLSRGEMQRTALARAVFGRPLALLADEPTASLDAANEAAVTDLLLDYGREYGMTVIVSTHQPSFRDRADLRVRLDRGRLFQEHP